MPGYKKIESIHSSTLLSLLEFQYFTNVPFFLVIFSIIGVGYLTYRKKSRQLLMLICSKVLMGYSYFVDGTAYIILIGVGLSALPFILGRK
jgi:hypothetical protein